MPLHVQVVLFETPTPHLFCLFNSYFFRNALSELYLTGAGQGAVGETLNCTALCFLLQMPLPVL